VLVCLCANTTQSIGRFGPTKVSFALSAQHGFAVHFSFRDKPDTGVLTGTVFSSWSSGMTLTGKHALEIVAARYNLYPRHYRSPNLPGVFLTWPFQLPVPGQRTSGSAGECSLSEVPNYRKIWLCLLHAADPLLNYPASTNYPWLRGGSESFTTRR
jgi:hypothetical protein